MLGPYACQFGIQVRLLGLHAGVQQVFLGMMHCVGIDRHVTHDVVNQLVVGPLASANMLDLLPKKVEHDRHIAVVFAQIVE